MNGPAANVESKSLDSGKFLDFFTVDGIWVAILSSVTLFFWGQSLAEVILYVYLVWLACRKENPTWSGLLTLSVFLFLGWFAAHRFELGKIPDFGMWTLLPFLIMVCFIILSDLRSVSRVLDVIRLHWFPFSILAANLVVWITWKWLSFQWGVILLFLLIQFSYRDWKTRFCSTLTAGGLYVMIVHLFQWRGIIVIGIEPLTFLAHSWNTLLIPCLVAAVVMGRAWKLRQRIVE